MTVALAIFAAACVALLVDWLCVIRPLRQKRDFMWRLVLQKDRVNDELRDKIDALRQEAAVAAERIEALSKDQGAARMAVGRAAKKSDDLTAKLQEAESIIAEQQGDAEAVAEVEALQETVRALEVALASSEAELAGCRAEQDEARQCDSIAMAHIDKFEAVAGECAAQRDAALAEAATWRATAENAGRLVAGAHAEVGRLNARLARFERRHGDKGRFVANRIQNGFVEPV